MNMNLCKHQFFIFLHLWLGVYRFANDRESVLHDRIIDFKNILEADNQIVTILNQFYEEVTRKMRVKLKFSGSMKEGTFSASMFNGDPKNKFNLDIDVKFIPIDMTAEYKHCVEDMRPGFVELRFDKDCFCRRCTHKKIIEDERIFDSIRNAQGYLLSFKCRKAVLDILNLEKNINSERSNLLAILNFFQNRVKLQTIWENITKTTYQRIYEFQRPKMNVTADVSIIMYCEWNLHKILSGWLKRKRVWPNLRDLVEELNHTEIIAKPSSAEKYNEKTTELRYSFEHIERKLVSLQSRNQRFVFYVAKCIFYKWLKPIQPKILTSFLIKNIMFWLCESHHAEHRMWQEEHLEEALRLLFVNLLQSLKTQFMKYYFIPKVNVLENFQPDLYPKVIKNVKMIVNDISKHIPNNTKEVLINIEAGRQILGLFVRQWDIYKLIDFKHLSSERKGLIFVLVPSLNSHLSKSFVIDLT